MVGTLTFLFGGENPGLLGKLSSFTVVEKPLDRTTPPVMSRGGSDVPVEESWVRVVLCLDFQLSNGKRAPLVV